MKWMHKACCVVSFFLALALSCAPAEEKKKEPPKVGFPGEETNKEQRKVSFVEPTGFQGIPWGAPVETVRKAYPKLQRVYVAQGLPYYAVKRAQIGEINNVELQFSFVNDGMEFVSMGFQNAITNLYAMKDALIAEYGNPTANRVDGQLQWIGKEVTIEFREDPTVYSAYVNIFTMKYAGALAEYQRNRANAVRKDLFAGSAKGFDLTTKRCVEYLRDVPRPINVIDDMTRNNATNHLYIYVTKEWYKLKPEHKKSLTLYNACGNQLIAPEAVTEIQDVQTKKKLAFYGPNGFVSYE